MRKLLAGRVSRSRNFAWYDDSSFARSVSMLRDERVIEATWCGAAGSEGGAAYENECAKLHGRLKRIVKARGALDAQEAEALREAERLRMWRHFGYGSLIEYMELEMGYVPRMALERLRVAKAIVELPAIADAMAQGDLSFSAGRELTRVATAETEQQWLEAAGDKNMRDVEDMVSGHKRGDKPSDPIDPKLRTRSQRFDAVDDETRAMLRQARQILERERGERIDDCALLRTFARMVIDGAASPDRKAAPYLIAITTCDRCKRGWQDGGGITVEMSPATLETALCDAMHIGRLDEVELGDDVSDLSEQQIKQHAKQPHPNPQHHAGATACDVEATAKDNQNNKANRGKQHKKRARSTIPPAMRRRVKHRDHGRCRVPWCRSSRNCDQHHIVPLARGGDHTDGNLITLCESHHLAHHAGALIIEGTAASAVFKRRAHHALATAERAVETAQALKALGFDRHEVNAAMEKTRAHVGTSELTLEQWIKIALGYCPKPR
jgi:hypothetical protein